MRAGSTVRSNPPAAQHQEPGTLRALQLSHWAGKSALRQTAFQPVMLQEKQARSRHTGRYPLPATHHQLVSDVLRPESLAAMLSRKGADSASLAWNSSDWYLPGRGWGGTQGAMVSGPACRRRSCSDSGERPSGELDRATNKCSLAERQKDGQRKACRGVGQIELLGSGGRQQPGRQVDEHGAEPALMRRPPAACGPTSRAGGRHRWGRRCRRG